MPKPLLPKVITPANALIALIQRDATPSCCIPFWQSAKEHGKIQAFLRKVEAIQDNAVSNDDEERRLVSLISDSSNDEAPIGKLFHHRLEQYKNSKEFKICNTNVEARKTVRYSLTNTGEQ